MVARRSEHAPAKLKHHNWSARAGVEADASHDPAPAKLSRLVIGEPPGLSKEL